MSNPEPEQSVTRKYGSYKNQSILFFKIIFSLKNRERKKESTSVKTICDNIEIVEKFKCKIFQNKTIICPFSKLYFIVLNANKTS